MRNPGEFSTISRIHDAFDRKRISPTELIKSTLAAAKADRHGIFLTVCEERALAQARKAEEILSRNGSVPRAEWPLLGVPLGVKDNLTLEGVRTTCGSRILDNYVPPYTATALSRLESGGAITVGKLNLDEFAMGGSNENSAYGPVKNPLDPTRVPGGSSGGSAAALAAGLCAIAVGTDTGGSIRLPASYCGVVGLKPTYGRVSRYGLVAFASSLDQAGPMTNSVSDAATMLGLMSGWDGMDSTSSGHPKPESGRVADPQSWPQLKVGVPIEYFVGGLASDVEKAMQEALKWFESKGARLIPISLPHTQYAVAVYYVVALCEASSNLARFDGVRYGVRSADAQEAGDLETYYNRVRRAFGPEVKRRIILGTFALSAGYADAYYKRACQVRRLIKKDFDDAFDKVDVIVGPVAPTTAFKLGEKTADPLQMYLNDIFTIPANLAGLPAISIPCGKDSSGLPIGLHMMTPHFEEPRLLLIADAFEMESAK